MCCYLSSPPQSIKSERTIDEELAQGVWLELLGVLSGLHKSVVDLQCLSYRIELRLLQQQ